MNNECYFVVDLRYEKIEHSRFLFDFDHYSSHPRNRRLFKAGTCKSKLDLWRHYLWYRDKCPDLSYHFNPPNYAFYQYIEWLTSAKLSIHQNDFDTNYYLETNADIKQEYKNKKCAGLFPWQHFLRNGMFEMRYFAFSKESKMDQCEVEAGIEDHLKAYFGSYCKPSRPPVSALKTGVAVGFGGGSGNSGIVVSGRVRPPIVGHKKTGKIYGSKVHRPKVPCGPCGDVDSSCSYGPSLTSSLNCTSDNTLPVKNPEEILRLIDGKLDPLRHQLEQVRLNSLTRNEVTLMIREGCREHSQQQPPPISSPPVQSPCIGVGEMMGTVNGLVQEYLDENLKCQVLEVMNDSENTNVRAGANVLSLETDVEERIIARVEQITRKTLQNNSGTCYLQVQGLNLKGIPFLYHQLFDRMIISGLYRIENLAINSLSDKVDLKFISGEEFDPVAKTLNGNFYLVTDDDRIFHGVVSNTSGQTVYRLESSIVGAYNGSAQMIVHIEYQIDIL